MTKTLVLIRHAKSDWSGDEEDIDRPLSKRGTRQAPESGAWIAANLHLDLAVVSPAKRALATWKLIEAELSVKPEVRIDEGVYAAWGQGLMDIVRELPDSATTVALVGHNPGLEDLLHQLTGGWQALKTSTVAVVDLEGSWAEAGHGATLRTVGRPPC
ncbi:MAG TPA: histidine phosphatase family protein [Nocardioidaceae bacterium]|nr:histidine phosphatase family protein [Nocardioidaceae bacterium]